MRVRNVCQALCGIVFCLGISDAIGEETIASSATVNQELLDDAWWTGPLWASSAATLPQGHYVIEPYLFDSMVYGRFDDTGVRRSAAHEDDYSSRIFFYYGLTEKATIGVIPQFGFNDVIHGMQSSEVGLGDITAQAQYLISQFHEGALRPTLSALISETFPTGRYDRLGNNTSNGLGQGAYTTTFSLYSQYFFWLPNGRIVRARLDLSYSLSNPVGIKDTSVYGTPAGFRGKASPGSSGTVDLAGEVSVTRSWVFAAELIYQSNGDTQIAGARPQANGAHFTFDAVQYGTGSNWSVGVAPAIEFNWNDSVGIIVGAEFVALGRNTSAAVVPTVALNCYF